MGIAEKVAEEFATMAGALADFQTSHLFDAGYGLALHHAARRMADVFEYGEDADFDRGRFMVACGVGAWAVVSA